jgi:hypothetical protein
MDPMIGLIRSVGEMVVQWLRAERGRHKAALTALSAAVAETELYLRQIETRGEARDYRKEAKICRLWHAAGLALADVEPALGQACIAKAEYWADPGAWEKEQPPAPTAADVTEALPTVKQMTKELKRLMAIR